MFCKRVLQSDWKSEGVPFYRAREIVKLAENGFVENDLFISEHHYQDMVNNYEIPQENDLMISAVGTIGKVYIVKKEDCFYYKDASVICFQNISKIIDSQFAKIMLESTFLQQQMLNNSKGTTVDTITISTAQKYLCLLPPLEEQINIVLAVNRILEYVNLIKQDKGFYPFTCFLTYKRFFTPVSKIFLIFLLLAQLRHRRNTDISQLYSQNILEQIWLYN